MLQVLVAISQKVYAEKKHWAMQKLFIKKEEKKEKKEMNKIAHTFLQSCFRVSKERYIFDEHSRIRLSTIYIHHTSTHMHILIWLYDLTLFGSEVWLYNICIASMLFHAISFLWAPHKP